MYLYKVILCGALLSAGIESVVGINCFQCDGTDSRSLFQCGEDLRAAGGAIDVSALPCDQVHDARYCIKHVGRYEGGIGAKRYCSSKDLGNYCNYVKQPGDQLEYRSCIFTCDSDGCNSAAIFMPSALLIIAVIVKIIL